MTLETFFEKFGLFADASDAVEKMRGLVLELAVRGKLTAANPPDPLAPFPIPAYWWWTTLTAATKLLAAALAALTSAAQIRA